MQNTLPKVYIGVPTGHPKEYSTLYMLASFRNLDYPPEKLKLTFAVTCIKDNLDFQKYARKLRGLLKNANMPFKTNVIERYVTKDDMKRWGPYFGVICNLHELRLNFLQQDYDYFWLLGGDNPPSRDTLKKLLKVKGDVVSAVMKQRPVKTTDLKATPVVWQHNWYIEDIPKDLEPVLRDELRRAWLEIAFYILATVKKGQKVLPRTSFGSGCSLIKREVFEYIGYNLGKAGMHSEDLHFTGVAQALGFSTKTDLTTRCMHFDSDGKIY